MRKIFVAFAAALLVTAGNAVSLRQFQARDNNELAPAQQNNNNDGSFETRPEAPQQDGEQQQAPRPPKKRGPRPPPRRQDGETQQNEEKPEREVKTFAQVNRKEHIKHKNLAQ